MKERIGERTRWGFENKTEGMGVVSTYLVEKELEKSVRERSGGRHFLDYMGRLAEVATVVRGGCVIHCT